MDSKFKHIDKKLIALSEKLNAKLAIDRPSYPEELRTFEERRIDWVKDDIFLAIIIQPIFSKSGVNQKKWNFINFAWKDDGKSSHRPQKFVYLIKEKKFKEIEQNIDSLLIQSEVALQSITENELL